MSYVTLNNDDAKLLQDGNDSIVIVKNLESLAGGRALNVQGFAPPVIRAGHVIIRETATGEFKPMPATDLQPNGVATTNNLVAGTGYTNGTYENVPLATTGKGKGVLATVVVGSTVVSSVTITQKGVDYKVGDVLTVPAIFAGSTATTLASVTVATVSDTAGAYGSLPAGHTYEGINVATILTRKPSSGIMVRGTVNSSNNVSPYPIAPILSAFKTACPLIRFTSDTY